MKLQAFARAANKKSEAKRIRREGNIPAIIYSKGKAGKNVAVNGADYHALLRKLPKGHLSTTILTLAEENGTEHRVIVKDIQYHITTYDVEHIDFEEIVDGVQVNVNVPIECTGIVDCAGIKLGGVLRQVIRKLKVRCLPADIPQAFELDIKSMNIGESARLSALDIPETVRPLMDLKEVIAVIAKR